MESSSWTRFAARLALALSALLVGCAAAPEAGRRKPAWDALVFLNGLFGQPFRCADGDARISRSLAGAVQVHAFAREDGSFVVGAWLPTVPLRATDAGAEDRREETLDLWLPDPVPDVRRFDARGRGASQVGTEPDAGGTWIRGVRVAGGETVVLVAAPGGHASERGSP